MKEKQVCGMSYNNTVPSASVHVFMKSSLLTPNEVVVHILQTNTLNANEFIFINKKNRRLGKSLLHCECICNREQIIKTLFHCLSC